MIEQKRWGEFMFAFWKMIKKYMIVSDWAALMDEADKMMSEYPEAVFRGIVFGFLEQKSIESIRNEKTT